MALNHGKQLGARALSRILAGEPGMHLGLNFAHCTPGADADGPGSSYKNMRLHQKMEK